MTGKTANRSRLEQLVTLLGETFDGVITFDEIHRVGNVAQNRGMGHAEAAEQPTLAWLPAAPIVSLWPGFFSVFCYGLSENELDVSRKCCDGPGPTAPPQAKNLGLEENERGQIKGSQTAIRVRDLQVVA